MRLAHAVIGRSYARRIERLSQHHNALGHCGVGAFLSLHLQGDVASIAGLCQEPGHPRVVEVEGGVPPAAIGKRNSHISSVAVYSPFSGGYTTAMTDRIARLDKTAFCVSPLAGPSDDKAYWLSKTPGERLEALEIMRQTVYGYDPDTTRLQRLFEIAQRSR